MELANEPVTVTFPAGDWADIVAVISQSPLDLFVKERLNSAIYDCVIRQVPAA
jgi:hypothetical protein